MAPSDQARAAEGSGRRASRRSERRRSSLPGSIRAAALRRSARGGRCLAPRCPALEFGRQFQRRERPALRRARASFQSVRSRNRKSPEFRARAAPALARFVAQSVPGVQRPHQADRLPLGCARAARAGRVQRSRRSLRQANRQGACRRGGRPPRRRRGSAAPRPRYSTPWLYSCPRPSLGGRESPDERRRRAPQFCRGSW